MRSPATSIGAMLALTVAAALPAAAQETSHPAGIYVGSCPVPGNMLVSLWDVSPNFLVDGEADAGAAVGTQSGVPVEGSVTIVDFPLADLVASEHAIVVHQSQAAMDDYLVCGDIGGLMVGPDELPVALDPVGLSPWAGIAVLDDDGRGTTTVSVWIFEGPAVDTRPDGDAGGPLPAPTRSPENTFDADAGLAPGRNDDDDDRGGDDDEDDSGQGGDDDDATDDDDRDDTGDGDDD